MKILALAAAGALFPVTAMADAASLTISDAYARSTNPKSAAAFMTITNAGPTDCILTAASGSAAERIELHTHQHADGIMKMLRDEDGFLVPAGGTHRLDRGGDHVMMLGLAEPLADGGTVTLGLDFGDCGALEIEVPVDNARPPEHGATDQGATAGDAAGGHEMHAPAD